VAQRCMILPQSLPHCPCPAIRFRAILPLDWRLWKSYSQTSTAATRPLNSIHAWHPMPIAPLPQGGPWGCPETDHAYLVSPPGCTAHRPVRIGAGAGASAAEPDARPGCACRTPTSHSWAGLRCRWPQSGPLGQVSKERKKVYQRAGGGAAVQRSAGGIEPGHSPAQGRRGSGVALPASHPLCIGRGD
jgi:hypothetical protein